MLIANHQKTVKIFLNAFVGFEEYATIIRSFLLAFRWLQILNIDTVVTLLPFSSLFCKLHEGKYHLSCLLLFLQHHLQCLAHSRCPNNWINECMNEKTKWIIYWPRSFQALLELQTIICDKVLEVLSFYIHLVVFLKMLIIISCWQNWLCWYILWKDAVLLQHSPHPKVLFTLLWRLSLSAG